MIFLIANIFFASSFALCIKWVENRQRECIVTVGMISYIVSALISLPEFFQTEAEYRTNVAMITGATNGGCYFLAFFFCVYAIKWIGVANSTVIGILSILAPIVCGIFIWNERPSPVQVAGILLAMVSLCLIGGKEDATSKGTVPDRPWFTPWIIVGFFLLCGLSRLAQEAFKHMGSESERPVYLTTAFVIAAVPSLAVLIWRGRRIIWSEWLMGIALGSANIFQAHFILKALAHYDGFIVFPIVSAGSLLLVTLVATRFMGERLGWRTWLGIAIACVSLALLKGFPES